MTIVLASSSPRRKMLLNQALFSGHEPHFEIVSPDIDESHQLDESPELLVVRLATEKAKAGFYLAQEISHPIVIGSDTIVVYQNMILGKPKDHADAVRILTLLSGQKHQVMTAIAITDGNICRSELVITEVKFCEISAQMIEKYIVTNEPMDKAGAYGIQGLGGAFVEWINGSYSAVVGLPLVQTRELLKEFTLL